MPDGPTRILVIDDSEVKRYTVTRVLQMGGFEVTEGETGSDAVRMAAAAELIVLDIKLPDINGYEVCKRLKATPATAHIPILLLSATFVGPASQAHGLESGADAYLTDAAEPPVLLATVRALLRIRRAEDQARKGEARLRIALEAGKLGEWELDLATGAMCCSSRCKAIFGLSSGLSVTLDDLLSRVYPEDGESVQAEIRRSAAENADYDQEFRLVEPGGASRWVLVRGQVVPSSADHARRMIGVALDINDRKLLEQDLKDADRRKDEFLAMLAHELRNPLAPIRAALHILQQPAAGEDAIRRAQDMMGRQFTHMVRLIDDLLDVGRITKGRIELRRERVPLARVIENAVETSRPLIEAGRHRLTVVPPESPIELEADQTRISQVIANLLNNAAKYTPEGGQIQLTSELSPDGREAIVRVRDTGSGISPPMLTRIWDLFTQVDQTLDRAQGGLGIGLTLVKRLVELHGGSVEARSPGVGLGSEFIIRLPACASSMPPDRPQAANDQRAKVGVRVLIVDDNVDAAESLAMLLGIEGHTTRIAHDGPSALPLAAQFDPHVVLLDIGLPGLDGFQVAQTLRAASQFEKVFLIALTGWGQDSDRAKSRAAGFDLHLVKPIDPIELLRIIASKGP
ncbi:hybrid sensor histidine kinase/response regulator [Limnoglobus roseus]|uniref:histidine kinase n=1 Tax=Limnoglobus roseus TaxID=2598579 RepID=A0A5C1ATX4_9BACT|nr:response regulator [Limnoglobus roseus]QEL20228.1 PAS domain S-box protein [Limnoglobus roseus]